MNKDFDERNWIAAKATFERMQAEYRDLVARVRTVEAANAELARRIDAQQKTISLLQSRR